MGRLLAIPGVLLIILLVALGAQSEPPEDFQDRQEQEQQASSGSDGSHESSGGDTDGESSGSSNRSEGETRYRYTEEGGQASESLEPPTRVSIETEGGRIAFEANGVEDNEGITWDIDEPLPGSLVGFREVDGEYFPVTEGSEQSGDYLISWEDDVLILREVDGGVTEVRRGDDGLTGSYTDADGNTTTFPGDAENGDDGPVTVNPDLQAEPEDVGPIFGVDPSDPFEPPFGKSWPWSLIGLGTALTMFVVGMWLIFKDGIGLATVNYSVPQHNRVARGPAPANELSLFERLRLNPDADAVVRELYGRAVSGEWRIPSRHHEETPLEFYSRVRDGLPSDAALELGRLTDLYSGVRFAPQFATLEDRDRAIDIAERLLQLMQRSDVMAGA